MRQETGESVIFFLYENYESTIKDIGVKKIKQKRNTLQTSLLHTMNFFFVVTIQVFLIFIVKTSPKKCVKLI